MSSNYDSQLIASVKLAQIRTEGSLLFGTDRLKRVYKNRLGTFIIGVIVAALICTGCVLAAWIMKLFADGGFGGSPAPVQTVVEETVLPEELPVIEEGTP